MTNQVIQVAEGKTFTMTQEVILNLQKPRKVPSRGGLPLMFVLEKARSRIYGGNPAFWPPIKRLPTGMVIFVPDQGLNVGEEFVFVWATSSSAAAVPISQRDEYLARYKAE